MDQNARMELRDYCDMIRMNADSIRQELQDIKGPVKRKLEKSIFAIQVWLDGIDANVANILADVDEAQEAWSWHPFNPWENSDPELKDHYFYLVKTKDRATPMKAMYHIDNPFGFAPVDGGFDPEEVTAWIELPKVVNGK